MSDACDREPGPFCKAELNFHQVMTPPDDGEIDRKLQQRLDSGEYVSPDRYPIPAKRSMFLLTQSIEDPNLQAPAPTLLGVSRERSHYGSKAEKATADITNQEVKLVKDAWSHLSPDKQKAIQLQAENRQFTASPAPDLDSFLSDITAKIVPLEAQRQATYHQVWKDLPTEMKKEILREPGPSKSGSA